MSKTSSRSFTTAECMNTFNIHNFATGTSETFKHLHSQSKTNGDTKRTIVQVSFNIFTGNRMKPSTRFWELQSFESSNFDFRIINFSLALASSALACCSSLVRLIFF
uniref:Transmembrane protein n=1 Tax=Cacopsylla melanoneura TaxID=428564 RepID=A0A8D8T867_9HEMI